MKHPGSPIGWFKSEEISAGYSRPGRSSLLALAAHLENGLKPGSQPLKRLSTVDGSCCVLGQFKLFDYIFCCRMKQLHVVFIWFLAQQTTETPFIPLQIHLRKRPSIGREGRKMHGEIALAVRKSTNSAKDDEKIPKWKSPRSVPNKDALAQGFGASVWPAKAPTRSRTELLDRFRKNSPRHWPIQREAHRASCPQIHQGQDVLVISTSSG